MPHKDEPPHGAATQARRRALAAREPHARRASRREERVALPADARLGARPPQLVLRLHAPRQLGVAVRAVGVALDDSALGERHEPVDALARDLALGLLVAPRHRPRPAAGAYIVVSWKTGRKPSTSRPTP